MTTVTIDLPYKQLLPERHPVVESCCFSKAAVRIYRLLYVTCAAYRRLSVSEKKVHGYAPLGGCSSPQRHLHEQPGSLFDLLVVELNARRDHHVRVP